MYEYVRGYSGSAEEKGAAKYLAAITEGIESANQEFGHNYDPYDYAPYFEWLAKEQTK